MWHSRCSIVPSWLTWYVFVAHNPEWRMKCAGSTRCQKVNCDIKRVPSRGGVGASEDMDSVPESLVTRDLNVGSKPAGPSLPSERPWSMKLPWELDSLPSFPGRLSWLPVFKASCSKFVRESIWSSMASRLGLRKEESVRSFLILHFSLILPQPKENMTKTRKPQSARWNHSNGAPNAYIPM